MPINPTDTPGDSQEPASLPKQVRSVGYRDLASCGKTAGNLEPVSVPGSSHLEPAAAVFSIAKSEALVIISYRSADMKMV